MRKYYSWHYSSGIRGAHIVRTRGDSMALSLPDTQWHCEAMCCSLLLADNFNTLVFEVVGGVLGNRYYQGQNCLPGFRYLHIGLHLAVKAWGATSAKQPGMVVSLGQNMNLNMYPEYHHLVVIDWSNSHMGTNVIRETESEYTGRFIETFLWEFNGRNNHIRNMGQTWNLN